ncbi:MAG TPA: NYN domain-containing protein, partial [Candidatus Agrococcus pullicola]|nr:NYN domain-containing protein [Candidatus Agrococcus pullicola]
DAAALGLSEGRWYPELSLVVEGKARGVEQLSIAVQVVSAPGSGDDEIVRQSEALVERGRAVTVVTSDRALSERIRALGASVEGARWLLGKLDGVDP